MSPRYDFECLACRKQTVIFLEDRERPTQVSCEFCGRDVKLVEYDQGSREDVYLLQMQIQTLLQRIDYLEEVLEEDDDLDDTDRRRLNRVIH